MNERLETEKVVETGNVSTDDQDYLALNAKCGLVHSTRVTCSHFVCLEHDLLHPPRLYFSLEVAF